MKLFKNRGPYSLFILLLVVLLQGCGKDPGTLSEQIVGLWAVEATYVDNMDITNPNNWFDFHRDGTVDTRAGDSDDKYQSGTWTINEKDSSLKMDSKDHGTMTYKLKFEDGKFIIEAPTAGKNLKIIGVRTDKKPDGT